MNRVGPINKWGLWLIVVFSTLLAANVCEARKHSQITWRQGGPFKGKGKMIVFEGQHNEKTGQIYQEVKIKPDTEYTIKVYTRYDKTGGGVTIQLGWGQPYFYCYDACGFWAEHTVKIKTDPYAETECLILGMRPGKGGANAWLDDVRMTGPDGKNIVKNGQFELDKNKDGKPDEWVVAEPKGISSIKYVDRSRYLGENDMRMKYYQYKEACISPDMISPLYLGVEWSFNLPKEKRPKFKAVLELPEGVEVKGYTPAGYGSLRYSYPQMLPSQQILRNGDKYTRYLIEGTTQKWADFFWPGNNGFVWFLETTLKEGVVKAYYHMEWEGGKQQPVEIPLRVIRIEKIGQPERLLVGVDPPQRCFNNWPRFLKSLQGVGVNLLDCRGLPTGPIKAVRRKNREFRKRGLNLIYMTVMVNKKAYAQDKESWAERIDGRKAVPVMREGYLPSDLSPCPSYRGKAFQDFVEEGKKIIDRGTYWINFDDEIGFTCFCEKCLSGFKSYLKENYSVLEYKDPHTFEKAPEEYPMYHEIFHDYGNWLYGKAILDYKKALQDYAKEKWQVAPEKITMVNCAVARHRAASYAFDYLNQMNYINYCSFFSPKIVGDDVQKYVSEDAPFYPLLSPGLTYEGMERNGLEPHSIMKYQIWESLCAGAKGYALWAFSSGIDLLDMKYMADAMRVMNKVEDIIMDGKPTKRAKVLSKQGNVRTIECGDEAVVLVSDYSTYEDVPLDVEIEYKVKKKVKVIDLESGEEIGQLGPAKDKLKIRLSRERARVLYIGKRNLSEKVRAEHNSTEKIKETGETAVASTPELVGKRNLLKNAGLEVDGDDDGMPDNWEKYQPQKAYFGLDTEVFHSGKSSFCLSCEKLPRVVGITQTVDVTAGKKYEASCWVKGEDLEVAFPGTEYVFFLFEYQWLDSNSKTISSEYLEFNALKNLKDWVLVKDKVRTAPANAVAAKMLLGMYRVNGTCWYDDVALTEVE